jgi:thiol:disulfide interchange protein DsbD
MPIRKSSVVPFAAVFVLLATAWSANAQPVQGTHARLELLSKQTAVTPGKDLMLGVHFMMEKGWHIYWINPGDSGQAPGFSWQLPSGFTAGDILWPKPERMQNSPTLADYGYHDDVLLMVPIHVAPALSINGHLALPFAVDAKWLICREVCIPGKAQLKLSLPQGTPAENPATAKLFADTEKTLPAPWPRSWKATLESQKTNFVLTIDAGKPISKAFFFPLNPDQIDNPSPQLLRVRPRGAAIALRKSELLMKPLARLSGVLVLGNGSAYRLVAPSVAAKAIK